MRDGPLVCAIRPKRQKTGRRLTSDPIRTSLGLLPSGPDPVGEWLVHRQSPGPYLGPKGQESKRGQAGERLSYHANGSRLLASPMTSSSGVSSKRRIIDKSMGLGILDHP